MIEELREEAHLYNFLRQVYLSEPSKQLIRNIMSIDTLLNDDGLSDGLSLMIKDAQQNKERLDEWLEELAAEYARLFIGPKNTPAIPYASFYLSESRALMTDETIAVRQSYLDAGMQVKALHAIPDDHIGIELEFLFYLTNKIIELHESGMDGDAARFYEMREIFLRNHCTLWFPELARRIIDNTGSAFYKGAALLLKDCVEGV